MGKKLIVYISNKSIKLVLGIVLLVLYLSLLSRVNIPAFSLGTNQLLQVFFIGLALGTDAFSLSVGIGMKRVCGYDIIKTSIVIGIFHILMPLIGLVLGEILGSVLGIYAKYLGSLLIALIGVNMIYECLKCNGVEDCDKKLVGWSLIVLAISVSLDALTVGLGLGTFRYPIPLVVGIIGLLGGLMTALGLMFGRYIGEWFGEKSEMVGGVVLIILGLKMLLS